MYSVFKLVLAGSVASLVWGQAVNKENEYLIRQGILEDGSIEMYAPYFLWHGDVHNASAALQEPFELRSINGYLDITLTVRTQRVQTELFAYNTRVFCFNDICTAPGPTLYCNPGDSVKITLVNQLSAGSGISTDGPLAGQELSPNRTNIFIQGLNLDPALNNPFRYTSGDGDRLVYEYDIPIDTPPGAHWYHSRVHGVSALQVMGGLYGAFIVNPVPISATTDALGVYVYSEPIPKTLHAIVREVLVLSHIMLEAPPKEIPGVKGGTFSLVDEAGIEGFSNSSLSLSYLSRAYGSTMPLDAVYYNSTLTDVWLTNGQYQPTLTLQPGEWRVLDIVVASADRMVELELRTAVGYGEGDLACDVRLLALDGVYLKTARTGPSVTHLTLLQSGRASVAVMCATEGTYYLQTVTTFDTSNPHYVIGDYQTKSSQNLLIFNIAGNNFIMSAPPTDLSSIVRPAAILDSSLEVVQQQNSTTTVEVLSVSTAHGGCCGDTDLASASGEGSSCGAQFWLGMGPDCQPACYSELLCAALRSVLTATSLDAISESDAYSVRSFPTVRLGDCTYSSFASYGTYNSSAPQCLGQGSVNDASVIALARQTNPASAPPRTPIAHLGAVQEVTLWGHADFSYPIFVQNQVLQVASFQNVDRTVSNIVDSGEYVFHSSLSSAHYAQAGDFKETWPALTGKSKLYMRPQQYTGALLVMTPFLKYEDLGALRHILVQPAAAPDASSPPSENTSPTAQPTAQQTEPPVAVAPRVAQLDSDYAPTQYLCNTTGASFYYSEELDLAARVRVITTHSCPNHFSVCQSNECGGPIKTRALVTRQVVTVPLFPGFSNALLDATCNDMLLGVALNGVGIYGSSDGATQECVTSLGNTASGGVGNYTRELVGRTSCTRPGEYDGLRYCGDSVHAAARAMDKCGGYAGRDGVYKYQVTPACLQAQLSDKKVRDHSPQLGWALDGFPVFGPVGARGVAMKPCGFPGAHPILCLDVCGGYAGRLPGYDRYLYRYYFSGDVGTGECSAHVANAGDCSREEAKCCVSAVPPKTFRPYSIGCFRGCPFQQPIVRDGERITDLDAYSSCRLTGLPGTTEDFVPYAAAYATVVNAASNVDTSVPVIEPPATPAANETVLENVTVPANPRRVAVKDPLDGVVSILSFQDAVLNSTGAVADEAASYVAREELPHSLNDAYFTGMFIESAASDVIYYTTQLGIYSFNKATKESTPIIAGMLQVDIEGYNLGATLSDASITVGGELCTSVVHRSPERVSCMIVLREPNLLYSTLASNRPRTPAYTSTVSDLSSPEEVAASIVPYTIEQVQLTTPGGRAAGVSLLPLTVVRSGSGRPVMSHIALTLLPFAPYTVSVVAHNHTRADGTVAEEKTLYWSNVAYGAYSIQRSRLDGSQVETVVSNVQRAVSLVVVPVTLDQSMQYASAPAPACDDVLDTTHGLVGALRGRPDIRCATVGHMLYFADAQQGTLSRLPLFPLSLQEVFVQKTGVRLQDPVYYRVYAAQDTGAEADVVEALSQPVVLLQGVERIASLALDLPSSYMFVSARDGVILRVNYANLLGTASPPAIAEPVTLDLRSILRSRTAAVQAQLPSWIKLLGRGDTNAVLQALCVLPSAPSAVDRNGTRAVGPVWTQQRVLVLDTSQQLLSAYSEEGLLPSSEDLGHRHRVYWPHQIRCFEAAGSAEGSLPSADVYVSEYLGRVWKVTLPRDSVTGKVDFGNMVAPELVLDMSVFPASERLREFFNGLSVELGRPAFGIY